MAGSVYIGMQGTKGLSGTADPGGTAVVNLSTHMKIAPSGFSYKSGNDLLWTTFDLVSTDTDETFRNEMWKLDEFKDLAGRHISDATRSDPVWLFWKADSETLLRRSLIHDLDYEILGEEVLGANLGKDAAKVRLAVQHNPYWEAGTADVTSGTVSDFGGTIVLNLSDTSYPSRIQHLSITGWSGDTLFSNRTKAWVGIRDYRNGVSGFIPVWEAEAGTVATDASGTADASARGGTAIRISFATETDMVKRFSVKWGDIGTASYDHLTGKYLILGRLKLSAGTVEVAAELRHGWLGQPGLESSLGVTYLSAVTNPEYVNYNFVPLGVAEIPPTGDRDAIASTGTSISPLQSYGLALYAERLSGAGTMNFDCFVLVPADHMFITSQAAISFINGATTRAYTGDDDIPYAVKQTIADYYGNVEYSFDNWNLPVRGGVMVFVAQAGTSHALDGTVSASLFSVKRFRSYRGTA